MSEGKWGGEDYREVPIPDDLTECSTVQRRTYLWKRVNEEGHHSLLDKEAEAERLDISLRMVYYDMEAVREYITETLGRHHVAENVSVFEKAKKESLRQGDWKGAVEVLKKEAEWLEDRGAVDKEEEQVEVTWREYMEAGHDE